MRPRVVEEYPARPQASGRPAQPEQKEAVILDTLVEYRVFLPGVAQYLRNERRARDIVLHPKRFARITSRLAEIAGFQKDLNTIAYDKTRSFALTPGETVAARAYLDQIDTNTSPGELALRAEMARVITRCITIARVFTEPETFAMVQSTWLNEDSAHGKNQNPTPPEDPTE
jgi:hypothetical protein